ncbi:hypothetical protein CapIbe_008963 [Capra ibex]
MEAKPDSRVTENKPRGKNTAEENSPVNMTHESEHRSEARQYCSPGTCFKSHFTGCTKWWPICEQEDCASKSISLLSGILRISGADSQRRADPEEAALPAITLWLFL